MYESDLTRFMRQYLERHPEEQASQQRGRSIWWDKDPSVRTPPEVAQHTPRSGGAEYTFRTSDESDA